MFVFYLILKIIVKILGKTPYIPGQFMIQCDLCNEVSLYTHK